MLILCKLFLPLLVLRIRANHAHDSLAVNHLALVANLSDGSPNLHFETTDYL